MDLTTLGTLVKQLVTDAKSGSDEKAEHDRKALKYYRGDLYGDENVEESKYVSRDLAESIDGLMPGLMRVFFAGDQFGKFTPRSAQEEEAAQQATDLCDHVFLDQNRGFKIGRNAMLDALLQKTGIVEVGWDRTPRVTRERYRNLTDEELQALESDENIEISKKETRQIEVPGPPQPMPMMPGQPMPGQPMPGQMNGMNGAAPMMPQMVKVNQHDVTIKRTNVKGRVAVVNVPPEEFFVEAGAVDLESALICGRQYLTTASRLREEGFPDDDIEEAGDATDVELNDGGEKTARFGQERMREQSEMVDESTRLILRTDACLRVDWDDDGIAELRRVTCLGPGFIVSKPKSDDEEEEGKDPPELDTYPFAIFQGRPLPHKFHGESEYDKVGDLQYLNSTLWRQTLNSLYLSNQPQMFAQGDVDLEAALTVRPNNIISGGINSQLTPMIVPFVGKESFPMIEMVKASREERSGVTRYTQGLQADTLNKTATGINIIQSASEQKQELVARNFAEGFAQVYKLILKTICQHDPKPMALRVRGKWATMDPRNWVEDWDFTVSVGLGTGNKVQRAQQAMMLLQANQQMVMGGKSNMITDKNIYNGYVEFVRALDMKPAESFITDPGENPQPQQPPVDPKVVEIQRKYDQLMQKDQMDHQYRMDQAAKDHAVKLRQAELDAAVNTGKAIEDVNTDRMKAAAEVDLKRDVANADAHLARDVADHGARLSVALADHDARLKKDAHETDKALKKEGAAVQNQVKAAGAGLSTIKVAGGEDLAPLEEKIAAVADQQAETVAKIDKIAEALMMLAKPKRAVKRNGGWEQEYVN